MKKCIECSEPIEGRSDKIFCSAYCKSSYHYQRNKEKEEGLFSTIDKTLKRNRQLLRHFNAAGKSVVRKQDLISKGFNPKYFTHYWKNKKGDIYLFCYEYGFLEKKENGKSKYVLITWQNYMNNPSKKP